VVARLKPVRSTGLSYDRLHPDNWYRVERQNARTLWLVTSHGVVDVARQDFELREPSTPAAPPSHSRR
jgi:hypothetical protein